MPAKKSQPPAAVNIRLKPKEAAQVVADVESAVAAAGFPLTVSAYAKHAILSHGRLRRMESMLKDASLESIVDGVGTCCSHRAQVILEACK